jgi:hypothetical protein
MFFSEDYLIGVQSSILYVPFFATLELAFVDVWAEKCPFLGGLQDFKLVFASDSILYTLSPVP